MDFNRKNEIVALAPNTGRVDRLEVVGEFTIQQFNLMRHEQNLNFC